MNILNLCPFYTAPPDNGGKTRIFKINSTLGLKHNVFQFSTNMYRYLGKLKVGTWQTKVNSGYTEFVYSPLHYPAITAASNYAKFPPLMHLNKLLEFHHPKILDEKIRNCDLIQVEEPFIFDFAKKHSKKPIIADSQNVEYILATNSHSMPGANLKKWHKTLFEMEKRYATQSDLLLCASEEDAGHFERIFDAQRYKMRIIPNGVDVSEFLEVSETQRKLGKKNLGIENKFVVFFVGGLHPPNMEGLKFIYKLSEILTDKDIVFLIAGAVGDHEQKRDRFIFTKGGSHEQMIPYFKAADVALNPIFSGSGTNVKLLQYLSSALPSISSKFGTRGLTIKNKKGLLVLDSVEEYKNAILKIKSDSKMKNLLSKNARSNIIGINDFESITKKVESAYKEVLNGV